MLALSAPFAWCGLQGSHRRSSSCGFSFPEALGSNKRQCLSHPWNFHILALHVKAFTYDMLDSTEFVFCGQERVWIPEVEANPIDAYHARAFRISLDMVDEDLLYKDPQLRALANDGGGGPGSGRYEPTSESSTSGATASTSPGKFDVSYEFRKAKKRSIRFLRCWPRMSSRWEKWLVCMIRLHELPQ